MNKFLIILICLVLAFIISCGAGETKKPDIDEAVLAKDVPDETEFVPVPPISGGLVLSINGDAVMSDEVISAAMEPLEAIEPSNNYPEFVEQIGPVVKQILDNKIADILLYQEAKKSLSSNIDDEALDKFVEQEVQKYISQFGGNYAEAQANLKKFGFEDWKSFYRAKKKQILIEMYVSRQTSGKQPITHSELLGYYNLVKDEHFAVKGFIEFRLIDIVIEKLIDVNESDTKLAKNRAVLLAEEIIEGLGSGEDFAELAKACSHGDRAGYGGLWKPVRPPSLVEPYNVIEKTAIKMQPGEVSEPIEAGGHIFIVKLEKKQFDESEPFEKVQQQVEQMLVFEQRKKLVDELFNKLISQADIGNVEEFTEFCLEKLYQQN
jgi:peptidyl-prolyl cis-trans isomerase SurA